KQKPPKTPGTQSMIKALQHRQKRSLLKALRQPNPSLKYYAKPRQISLSVLAKTPLKSHSLSTTGRTHSTQSKITLPHGSPNLSRLQISRRENRLLMNTTKKLSKL